MTECARCVVVGKPGTKWHATGLMSTRVRYGSKGYIVATLACDREGCGNVWATTGRDAIDAGQAARAVQGLDPYILNAPPNPAEFPELPEREPGEDDDCPAPQPSLFRPRRSDRGFVKASAGVRGRSGQQIATDAQWSGKDVKRRASGDPE